MMEDSLKGIRIWISGSIPEGAKGEEQERIHRFLSAFAKEVFRRNGCLIHGSHPTLRDTLLAAAQSYKTAIGEKAGLVLAVSRFFSKSPEEFGIDMTGWNAICAERVIETREAILDPISGEISRVESLSILRKALVDQCNVIVAVGGKWWGVAAAMAGVPREIELARENHLPLFLLGGLGGSTRGYLEAHGELLRSCNNGLPLEANIALSQVENPEDLAKQIIDQISRLPLRTRSPKSGRPFRILCLDGGGIRGAFTAAVLAYWEKAGLNIAEHFDLIAGTSTGGILAIGLGLGMTAAEMLEFYKKEGRFIFPVEDGINRLRHSFRHWFGAKFDQSVLKEKLEAAYKKAPVDSTVLDNSLSRLVIPAYNTKNDKLIVFRTPHGSGGANDRGRNPVDVALATAAAPTYFNPVKIDHILAVDGGVWANCPTTVALAEAIRELDIEPALVEMLSIGTTFSPSLEGQPFLLDRKIIEPLLRPATGWLVAKLVSLTWKPLRIQGKLGWLPNIAGFLMKTQAQTAEFLCEQILGDRFLRIDEPTEGTNLDDITAIDQLIGLGHSLAEKNLRIVKTRFLNGVPADPWKIPPK